MEKCYTSFWGQRAVPRERAIGRRKKFIRAINKDVLLINTSFLLSSKQVHKNSPNSDYLLELLLFPYSISTVMDDAIIE